MGLGLEYNVVGAHADGLETDFLGRAVAGETVRIGSGLFAARSTGSCIPMAEGQPVAGAANAG